MRAAIYAGPGVAPLSPNWKASFLKKNGWETVMVGPADICRKGFLDSFDLLVIPGGQANVFEFALGEVGFRNIYDFWQHKTIWAACAGAFYLSRYSRWLEGQKGEICHDRELFVFGGETNGPYHKKQMSPAGTRVELVWDDGEITVARCFQGPVFIRLTNHDAKLVTYGNRGGACGGLISYAEDGPGRAILTGFHPEMDWMTGIPDFLKSLWVPPADDWEYKAQRTRERFAQLLVT